MTNPKIIDVYGFFGTIAGYWGRTQNHPPWHNTALDTLKYSDIDKLFFSRYGERPISRYVAEYLKMGNGELPINYQTIIADYVLDMFSPQWARLVADYTAVYDPIENYSMAESETTNTETGGEDSSTDGFTNYRETQKYGHTVTSNSESGIFGFNSNFALGDNTGDNTTTFGSVDDSGDTKEITGTRDYTTEYGKTEDITRRLTRHGNIGTLTASKMIQDDSAFWNDNNFFEKVVADIASILTIPFYD